VKSNVWLDLLASVILGHHLIQRDRCRWTRVAPTLREGYETRLERRRQAARAMYKQGDEVRQTVGGGKKGSSKVTSRVNCGVCGVVI
jgi:hypothetical protein